MVPLSNGVNTNLYSVQLQTLIFVTGSQSRIPQTINLKAIQRGYGFAFKQIPCLLQWVYSMTHSSFYQSHVSHTLLGFHFNLVVLCDCKHFICPSTIAPEALVGKLGRSTTGCLAWMA